MYTRNDYKRQSKLTPSGMLFTVICPDGRHETFHDELCADAWMYYDLTEQNQKLEGRDA